MDATKGTLGTIEKGEGATGGYISQKEQTNIPYTCTDYLLYTQHCGGKCRFFLASFLPSFFMGRVLHKRECRGGGNGIVFFQVFSVAYVDSINLDIAEKVWLCL